VLYWGFVVWFQWLDLGYLFKECIFSVTKMNTMRSKTKKHKPKFSVAVWRRPKLGANKAQSRKREKWIGEAF